MDSFSVCLTLVSVLLGIAYPILIQITSNDKYSSEHILDLFEKNRCIKLFIPNLIAILIFIGVYLLKLTPFFFIKNEFLNSALENSAGIIIFILTVFLIVNFLLITKLVTIFYRTSSLIKHLDLQSKNVIEKNDFSSFDGMADLLYWSIQNQDSNASKRLSSYFSKMFQTYQQKHFTADGIIYPDKFYFMVYLATEKIVGMERNNLLFLEIRTVGATWLLGEFNAKKISSETYSWLWKNLVLCVNSSHADLTLTFWHTTHQFFTFNLSHITPDYDFNAERIQIKNQKEIDERNYERESFLEFHYALGGLLLYKDRLDLIKRIFQYTTSSPPNYVLLPMHLGQILKMFFKFLDPYENHFPWITHKYDFPGLEGLNADYTIKDWICQYITILFIRQLNIQSFYVNWDPADMPVMPESLSEKRFWAEHIKYFKPILEKVLTNNPNLLENLNYNTDSRLYLDNLDAVEKYILNEFDTSQQEVIPEKDKILQFMEASSKILQPAFEHFDRLNNPAIVDAGKEKLTFNIQGLVNISSKTDFVDDGVAHLNFESYLAESVRQNHSDGYFQIFNTAASKKYVYDQENVFKAIDNLKLDPDKHIILAFGFVNINYYTENLKIVGLEKDQYNKIKMLFFPGRIYGISNSLFILAKSSLPEIEYADIEEANIDLYEAKPIIEKFNVYAAVSDLHLNTALRMLIEKEPSERDKNLHKSVWQGIIFKTVIKWQKGADMVQIIIQNEFENQRKKNELKDISAAYIK
jgi:hypothetical protein